VNNLDREYIREFDRETGLVDAAATLIALWRDNKCVGHSFSEAMELLERSWRKYGLFWNPSGEVIEKAQAALDAEQAGKETK